MFKKIKILLLIFLCISIRDLKSQPTNKPILGQQSFWDRNEDAIMIGGVFLVLGTLLGLFAPIWKSNYENRKVEILKFGDTWHSSFFFIDSDNSPKWYPEKVIIKKGRGKIIIECLKKDEKFNWEAEAILYGNRYMHGTWKSRNADSSKGTMAMNITMQSDCLYGYYAGSDGINDYKNGPWIIAQSEELINEKKSALHNPASLFYSDNFLGNLNCKWNMYHLTHFNDKEIWRYNEIDFSGNKDELTLTSSFFDKSLESNDNIKYKIDGGKRGPHLILFAKQTSGEEPYSTLFFPFFNDDITRVNYGFIAGQNLDGFPYIGQAILSKRFLYDINSLGTIDETLKDKFDERWRFGFKRIILPEEFSPKELNLSINGIDEIYKEFVKELVKRNKEELLEIDILGYTMFSVERRLQEWFEDGLLYNITINLYYLNHNFILKSNGISNKWANDVQKNVIEIEYFIKTNEKELEKLNVNIVFSSYSHMPAVHGFKIHESKYFISFAQWNNKGTELKIPYKDTFIKIEKNARSTEENALKQLFDNWILAALNDNLV